MKQIKIIAATFIIGILLLCSFGVPWKYNKLSATTKYRNIFYDEGHMQIPTWRKVEFCLFGFI